MALSVFHLSERTVMKPYLICFGATAMATLDLPVEGSNKNSVDGREGGGGHRGALYWWPCIACPLLLCSR